MKRLLPVLMGFTLLLLSPTIGWSADFQKGLDADKRGDYATALREFEPLAEQGLALAQYTLGLMYAVGKGVLKDYVYAHMWGNIAASKGIEVGGKLRDIVAEQMTPADLSKAKDLARECVRKKYKGC